MKSMNDTAQRQPTEGPEARGHEPTDVNPSVVALFTAGLLVLLVLAAWLVSGITRSIETAIERRDVPQSPLLHAESPPEPRLQADPAVALARWREEQEARRSSYEFADGTSDVVRIPVEEAIEILARRGFPEPEGRPGSESEGEPQP